MSDRESTREDIRTLRSLRMILYPDKYEQNVVNVRLDKIEVIYRHPSLIELKESYLLELRIPLLLLIERNEMPTRSELSEFRSILTEAILNLQGYLLGE